MTEPTTNLETLLTQIEAAADDSEAVTINAVMDAIGRRSFGPILLAVGLILASPLSGVPGLPTLAAILVLLIAVQLLMQRDHFWLPGWILERSIAASRIQRAMKALKTPARPIDKLLRPRLPWLTHARGSKAMAGVCILIVAVVPPLELMPFGGSIAGAVLAIFGLSLCTGDGLLALFAYALTGVMVLWLITTLL